MALFGGFWRSRGSRCEVFAFFQDWKSAIFACRLTAFATFFAKVALFWHFCQKSATRVGTALAILADKIFYFWWRKTFNPSAKFQNLRCKGQKCAIWADWIRLFSHVFCDFSVRFSQNLGLCCPSFPVSSFPIFAWAQILHIFQSPRLCS